MRLPEVLTELFDPAGRYLRLTSSRPRRRRRRDIPYRTAAYISVEAKHSEALDDAQRERLQRDAVDRRRSVIHEQGDNDKYVSLAGTAAGELRAHGHATIDTPSGTLSAEIVRFWRGDGVLEVGWLESSVKLRRVRVDRAHLGDVQRLTGQLAIQVWSILGT